MDQKTPKKLWGFFALLFAMVCGSLMSPLFKTALSLGAAPLGVAFWRMVMTVGVIFLLCRVKSGLWQDVKTIVRERKLFFEVLGMGLMRGFEVICWSLSLSMSGTFVVNILGNITPIFTIILVYLLYRERTAMGAILSVGLSLVGVVLIGLNGSATGGAPLLAFIIMPLSSFAYGVYLLLGREVTKRVAAPALMLFVFAVTMVMVLIFGTVSGMSMALPTSALPYVGLIALCCTLLSQTITSWCMKSLKPTTISVMNLFSPVLSATAAWLLIGEAVAPSILLGGGVVLLGLFLYLMAAERSK